MDYFGSFGKTEETALDTVGPIADSMLEAHEAGDYQRFSSLATDGLKRKVTPHGFSKAHQNLQPAFGRLLSKRFLGSLNRNGDPLFLWVAKYENRSDDVLIQIGFKNSTEPPRVDWIWIE